MGAECGTAKSQKSNQYNSKLSELKKIGAYCGTAKNQMSDQDSTKLLAGGTLSDVPKSKKPALRAAGSRSDSTRRNLKVSFMLPSPYEFEKEDKKKILRGDNEGRQCDEDAVRSTLSKTLPQRRHKPTSQILVKNSHQSHKPESASQILVKTSHQSQKSEPTSQILV